MLLERETEFETLYRTHYRRVYHYILRRIGDPETAQELTGDVFRIAWGKFGSREMDPDAGLPWLCSVAHNVLGNEYRGRKRRQALLGRLREYATAEGWGHGDGSGPGRNSTADLVMEALGRIPERHREVLILVYWDSFTTAELARCLGCSEGAAGVRIHRARKAFAAALPRNAEESAGN